MTSGDSDQVAPEIAQEPGGRRLALVIATSVYADPTLARLRAPGEDAKQLAAVLADEGIGQFAVETLLDQPADAIRRRIAQFCAKGDPRDLALVYLSCHGVLDDRGRLYYATADTERAYLSATAVQATWLNDQLEDCRCRRQILLLDCCHSGAFAKGSKGDSALALRERFEARGRVVLTASRATEYSFEGDDVIGDGVSSVFTRALVRGLRTGDADADGDGRVTVTELYDYAYHALKDTDARQNPSLWTYGAEGDLLIARSARGPRVEAKRLPEDLAAALASPRPQVRAGAVAALAELLTGPDAGRALTARDELVRVAAEDIRSVAEVARRALEERVLDVLPAAPVAAGPPPPETEPPPPRRMKPPAEDEGTPPPKPSAEDEGTPPPGSPPRPVEPVSPARRSPGVMLGRARLALVGAGRRLVAPAHRRRTAVSLIAVVAATGVTVGAIQRSSSSPAASNRGSSPIVGRGSTVDVYSSLPLQGGLSALTTSMVNGIKLALAQAKNKAGPFNVSYHSLDDSTAQRGGWDPGTVAANAHAAVGDPRAVYYVGEFNSDASKLAIPILNLAGLPEVSPSNNYVGLTTSEPGSEPGEPQKYFPTGRRTYLRIAVRDKIEAAALLKTMKADGCTKVALANDGQPYGRGLAALLELQKGAYGVAITGNTEIDPKQGSSRPFTGGLKSQGVDCFVYSGDVANGGVQITKDVAAALPNARIYGPDGMCSAGWTNPAKGGLPLSIDKRVECTVDTLDLSAYPGGKDFLASYRAKYGGGDPGPYALYGFEAMKLGLDTIAELGPRGDGRAAVLAALFATRNRASVLGNYGFDANGDTTLRIYGLYKVGPDGNPLFFKTVDLTR